MANDIVSLGKFKPIIIEVADAVLNVAQLTIEPIIDAIGKQVAADRRIMSAREELEKAVNSSVLTEAANQLEILRLEVDTNVVKTIDSLGLTADELRKLIEKEDGLAKFVERKRSRLEGGVGELNPTTSVLLSLEKRFDRAAAKPDRFGRVRGVSNAPTDIPEFTEGLDAAEEAMEDLRLVSRDALGEIDGVAKQTFGRIEGFMVRSLRTGKFEWRDLASEAVGALRKILDAQLETAGASSSLFGGSGGGIGGILGSLFQIGIGFLGAAGGGGASSAAQSTALSLSGPRFRFAHGGRPPVGVASLVGEAGPELFIPDSLGEIVPNDRLGGGGDVNVTYNIDARGAAPGMEQRIVQAIKQSENRAVLRAKFDILESARRGGAFARMARV